MAMTEPVIFKGDDDPEMTNVVRIVPLGEFAKDIREKTKAILEELIAVMDTARKRDLKVEFLVQPDPATGQNKLVVHRVIQEF
jgi:hypothetical protein